jgi:hypothetical protein
VRSTPQMAKKGKNHLAILTFFRFRRTDVRLEAKVYSKALRSLVFFLGFG